MNINIDTLNHILNLTGENSVAEAVDVLFNEGLSNIEASQLINKITGPIDRALDASWDEGERQGFTSGHNEGSFEGRIEGKKDGYDKAMLELSILKDKIERLCVDLVEFRLSMED